MKIHKTRKGFTLIELLVVITIIGILAVGGVSVFTTQLQGARDSTRINDMKLMETAIHQYFNDNSEFPATTGFTGSISQYISKELEDPKKGSPICWADATTNDAECEGRYDMGEDNFNLSNSAFKIGIRFEKNVNFIKKADNLYDGGNAEQFYEVYSGAGAGDGGGAGSTGPGDGDGERFIDGTNGVSIY